MDVSEQLLEFHATAAQLLLQRMAQLVGRLKRGFHIRNIVLMLLLLVVELLWLMCLLLRGRIVQIVHGINDGL